MYYNLRDQHLSTENLAKKVDNSSSCVKMWIMTNNDHLKLVSACREPHKRPNNTDMNLSSDTPRPPRSTSFIDFRCLLRIQ